MKNKRYLGLIFALISIVFWSLHAVSIRYLVFSNDISPNIIFFLRFFLGALFLLVICLIFFRKDTKKIIEDKKILTSSVFWLSSLFLFLNFLVFHMGLKYTLASDTILLETLSPVMVVIITLLFFPSRAGNLENIKKVFLIVVIATVGSSLIMSHSPVIHGVLYKTKLFGDFLEFLAMVFFAFFLVFNFELRTITQKFNGLVITALSLSVCAVMSLPFAIFGFHSLFPLMSINLWLILLISIGSTGIAYLTWFLAARYLNVITLALLFNIVGISTVVVEQLVYPTVKILSWKMIAGGLLILAASTYVEYLNSRKKKEEERIEY